VYYASHAYVLSFREALRHELAPRGVRVTTLCPGFGVVEVQVAGRCLNPDLSMRSLNVSLLMSRSPGTAG